MNNRFFLISLISLVLILLLAAPVLAAAACPSDCSCLLPAEAKKLGLPGYCNGKQAVCGYDSAKNEKYCYEKSASFSPVLVVTTTKPVVVTTTTKAMVTTTRTTAPLIADPARVEPATCPSTCACIPDEKARGAAVPLSPCGGTKTYCGDTADGIPMYCYAVPETVTPTTTTMATRIATEPCGSGCTCLSTDKAGAAGLKRCTGGSALPCDYDKAGEPMNCYLLPATTTKATADATTTTPPVSGTTPVPKRLDVTAGENAGAPAPGIISSVGTFFATLFGGQGAAGTGVLIIACPFGQTACDGECVDARTDIENCGSCRNLCPGQLPLCCDGTCSSLYSAENCGGCGNTCSPGSPCAMVDGWAVCSAAGCEGTSRSMDCGTGVCVDLDWDSSSCGTCGNACPAHSMCLDGVCTPCPAGSDRCGTGSLASGGECINIVSNPRACGGCGIVCDPDQICEGGICVACPAGTVRCGMNCVDLSTDRLNCGTCGNYCYDNELSGGTTCCSGSCTNLQADENNCGTCGNACGENQRCIGGMCTLIPSGSVEISCRLGQTACGMTCTDLDSDESNCGMCGWACPSGRICAGGVCLPPGGEDGCGLGQIRCDGRCVDPETSWSNCGRCGHQCPAYYTCRESTCTPFYSGDDTVCEEPGLDYCSGDCADLATSERHCGRCGNACVGGTCVNGECYYLSSDPDNCGSVGNRCGSGEICCSGMCRAEDTGDSERCACSSVPCRASDGFGCCNGYCWDLGNDLMNCGSCGNECAAGRSCCGGRCVDIWWNEDNCGRCGHACPWGKECQNGHCCLWGTTWGCD